MSEVQGIIHRLYHLNSIITSNDISLDDESFPKSLVGKEGLLDALTALYDQCNQEEFKKRVYIAQFLGKYKNVIEKVKKLRINLNDFEQKNVIGKGHFGVVQVVKERNTENVYAMKILQKQDTLNQKHCAFFETEREIMAKASSPWITRLQYAFQDDINLYLVMDFHVGGDLLSLLERYNYSFPESMVQFYLAEIIAAINALHSMGFAHRDIKPENILIDRCGHIKLADFGSAHKLCNDSKISDDIPVGTTEYIAPELLTALNQSLVSKTNYGAQCDYWSLGVIAYEMTFGETPFKGDSTVATYNNIMDYENVLQFPSDQVANTDLLEVIGNLLCQVEKRFGFSDLIRHKFFLHTDWNNLEAARPPFIPVVKSSLDTTNFENFDDSVNQPNTGRYSLPSANYNGENLPFIGFSFARINCDNNEREENSRSTSTENTTSSTLTSLNSTVIDMRSGRPQTELERELKEKRRLIHDLQQRLKTMSRRGSESERKALESQLIRSEKKNKKFETEISDLQMQIEQNHFKIKNLKDTLEMERKERNENENKSLEYVKEAKEKWKKNEEEKMEHLRHKVEMYQKLHETASMQKDEAAKELTKVRIEFHTLEASVQKIKGALKNKEKELKDLQNQLNQSKNNEISTNETLNLVTEIDRLRNSNENIKREREEYGEKTELEIKQREKVIEEIDLQRYEAEKNVIETKNALNCKEMECSNLEQKILEIREQLSLTKENEIQNLREKLAEKECEVEFLCARTHELTRQLDESVASREDFLRECESFETRLKCNEIEYKKVLDEKSSLEIELSNVRRKADEHKEKIDNLEVLLDSLKETFKKLQENEKSENKNSVNSHRKFDNSHEKPGNSHRKFDNSHEKPINSNRKFDNSHENPINSLRKFDNSHESDQRLKAQIELLEKQLSSAQESYQNSKEKMHVAQKELEEMQSQCKDAKLDCRVAQRELRDSQKTVEFLRERTKELKETISLKEGEIKEETEKQKQFESERIKHKKTEKELEEAVNKLKELKEIKIKLENEVIEKNKNILEIQNNVDMYNHEKQELNSQMERQKHEIENLKLQNTKHCETIERLKVEVSISEKTISDLKEVCSSQDEELQVVDEFHSTIKNLENDKVALKNEISRLENDLKQCRTTINEEKSLRLFHERQVKDLEQKLSDFDAENSQEKTKFNEKISEFNSENSRLLTEINNLESKLREVESRHRSLESKQHDSESQIDLMRVEIEGHVTHIHELKNSNFELTEAIEEAILKCQQYKKKLEEAENIDQQNRIIFTDKEHRLKTTIAQQTKLIEYLQTKVDVCTPKRKVMSRIFGTKENSAQKEYLTPTLINRQHRKIEESLEREKEYSKKLSIELEKARNRISELTFSATPKSSKKALDDISNSPLRQDNNKEIMKHSIPHRWDSHLVLRAGNCVGCMGNIPFSRDAAKCRDCNVLAHVKCSQNIGNTCGLPAEFAHHFKMSRKKTTENLQTHSSSTQHNDDDVILSGWVKVPKSSRSYWERQYAILTYTELSFYKREIKNKEKHRPLNAIKLFSERGEHLKTSIVNSVPRSELPSVVISDLPYVVKIEVEKMGSHYLKKASSEGLMNPPELPAAFMGQTSSKSALTKKTDTPVSQNKSKSTLAQIPEGQNTPASRSVSRRSSLGGQGHELFYMMLPNFDEKQKWADALEFLSSNVRQNEKEDTSACGKIDRQTLLCLHDEKMDVNTVLFLNKSTVLIGCVEGLFSFAVDASGKFKFRAQIGGVPSVYEIILIENLDLAVFIGGENNHLFHTTLSILKASAEEVPITKPSIEKTDINFDQPISCHLIAANQCCDRTFLCAAASNRICILTWEENSRKFEICRQYSTQEPCSCFEFSRDFLIVGAERFYKISLRDFVIEEFLDETDTSLAYAIYGSTQMSSFPVAIIQVSYREFLLIFYEFAIFVDANGRRTREFDVKFSRLPTHIEFRAPHLFILHHNAIDILEMVSDSYTRLKGASFDSDSECSNLPRSLTAKINQPRFLGNSFGENSIIVASTNKENVEILNLAPFFPAIDNISDIDSNDSRSTLNIDSRSTLDCDSAISFDSASIRSESSGISVEAGIKRTFPNFVRASKRPKKEQ